LIVNTLPGSKYMEPFSKLPVDVATLGTAMKYKDARVVFMRAAHETELRKDELIRAAEVELFFRTRGANVVNPVFHAMRAQRKDIHPVLIPELTPILMTNPTLQELHAALTVGRLAYPFVYRRADWSGGRETYLIHNAPDLVKAHNKLKGQRTVAALYVGKLDRGQCARWRVYIVGGIDMHSYTRSPQWIVGGEGSIECPTLPADVGGAALRTAEAFGLSILAVDIVAGAHPWVVDVNPTYFMTADAVKVPVAVNAMRLKHWERIVRYLETLQ